MTRLGGLVFALGVAWAAPLGAVRPASATFHTQLESSSPAPGDTVEVAPGELALTFGGFVEVSGAALRLHGPSGHSWALEAARLPGSSRVLTSSLARLEPGGYRLEWRVISGDGHPISGDFVFYVSGEGNRGSPLTPPPPPSAEGLSGHGDMAGERAASSEAWLMATRAAADAVSLLLAGLLLFASWGVGSGAPRTMTVARALAASGPLLAAGYAWLWAESVLGSAATAGARADALTSLFTGRALAAELTFLALVPWALILARRPRAASLFAIAAIVAGAFAGHPASYRPLLAVPASMLHQMAVAAWLGGLLFLVTESGTPGFSHPARRVSNVALWAVALVALTGLLQGWLFVDSPGQVVSTPFGLLLVGKTLGLIGLLGFGAYHRFRLVPRLAGADGPTRLTRSVGRELALAVGVVVLAAVMSHVPPNP